MRDIEEEHENPSKLRRALGLAAGGLLVFGVAGAWFWDHGAEKRAISKLSTEDRRAVYSRELESIRTLCAKGPGSNALADRCRAQAEFLLEFPECDDACQTLARDQLPHATK